MSSLVIPLFRNVVGEIAKELAGGSKNAKTGEYGALDSLIASNWDLMGIGVGRQGVWKFGGESGIILRAVKQSNMRSKDCVELHFPLLFPHLISLEGIFVGVNTRMRGTP